MSKRTNKIEINKLNYDLFKNYSFYFLMASITLAIGYFSVNKIEFGIISMFCAIVGMVSLAIMTYFHNKLHRIYEK